MSQVEVVYALIYLIVGEAAFSAGYSPHFLSLCARLIFLIS